MNLSAFLNPAQEALPQEVVISRRFWQGYVFDVSPSSNAGSFAPFRGLH